MEKVKVGFIGAGSFISAHHLLTVRDSDIMEIRAIADLDEELLEKHKANFNVGYTTTGYHNLLNDPEIDIVIIGTKQDLHAKFILESLKADKWTFCEKPMCETNAEAKQIIEAETKSKGRLAIGFNRRFAPAYMNCKKLMQKAKRPWIINYRLCYPNPSAKDKRGSFYANHERILYEGTHILDYVCWLVDDVPDKVYMTGDRFRNNCCILSFPDGTEVSFICGSIGAHTYWKEYMEVFAGYRSISVSDFIDMRVRGWKGEFDRVYVPYLNERAEEIKKYGFDFYEEYKAKHFYKNPEHYKENYNEEIEKVIRPCEKSFDVNNYQHTNPDLYMFIPDKGWKWSVEHFAQCFLKDEKPMNANGKEGALSTNLALALLASLDAGNAVEFKDTL